MAAQNSQAPTGVTVNVGTLSNALAVAIQQATCVPSSSSTPGPGPPVSRANTE